MNLRTRICKLFSREPIKSTPTISAQAGPRGIVGSKEPLEPISFTSLLQRIVRYVKYRGKAAGIHEEDSHNRADPNDSAISSRNAKKRASTFPERFNTIRLLGEGGNGIVHLCRDTRVGRLVAVKTVYHDEPSALPNEVYILSLLGHHQNIVQYHTMLPHPTQSFSFQLAFEYCPSGDLSDYVNAMEDAPTESFLWHVLKHVTNGLQFMHKKGIVHGDIKGPNILLTAQRDGEPYPLPKIADFGTAIFSPSPKIPHAHMCTYDYQPPEAEYLFGPEADMWALGCIIHEVAWRGTVRLKIEQPEVDAELWFHLSGKKIPPGTTDINMYKQFCFYTAFHPVSPLRIDRQPDNDSPVYSKLLNYLMMRTLEHDYRDRISADELKNLVTVLEPLFNNLEHVGYASLLDQFNDGRDEDWAQINSVSDSVVFRQLFSVLVRRANRHWDMELVEWANYLLLIMEPADQAAASQYLDGLDIGAML